MGFPQAVIGPLDEAIRRVWVLGIQNAGPYDSMSYEWKLSGRPCECTSSITAAEGLGYGQGGEAVPARRLIIHVLHALAAIGWHLAISVDLSKKQWDKDTLIFRAGPPIQRYFFSISFNMSDKVRIIDPPNEGIKQAFIQAVHVGVAEPLYTQNSLLVLVVAIGYTRLQGEGARMPSNKASRESLVVIQGRTGQSIENASLHASLRHGSARL